MRPALHQAFLISTANNEVLGNLAAVAAAIVVVVMVAAAAALSEEEADEGQSRILA